MPHKMEDYLIFFKNGRQPHFFEKWKKTSNFSKLEDDIIYFGKWKATLIQGKWKTTIFFKNRRRHKFFYKWKTTSKISKMQDVLNFKLKTNKNKSFLGFYKNKGQAFPEVGSAL
jgi:hypothetical protein